MLKKTIVKILVGWSIIVSLTVFSIYLFTGIEINMSSLLIPILYTLLFFISLFIYLKDPNKKSKFIFLNFTIFFLMPIVGILYFFIGSAILTDEQYAKFYFYQYHLAAYIFFLSLSIIYLVIDVLLHHFKIYQKYLIALSIVTFFFIWYFHPYILDPLYLYKTEDIKQWKRLSESVDPNELIFDAEKISKNVNLQSWKNGVPVGNLYPEENLKRIEDLEIYLPGDNYLVLLFKPLHTNLIYMNSVLLFFIMLFFGYQYKKDPPQGAYIDKIMFTFLLFISTEVLHYWGYSQSLEWKIFDTLFIVGQYISGFMLLFIIVFFGLRLKFICSAQGEFYETELAANPQQVSRWRDWIDTQILSRFFNLSPFKGRLFQETIKK